jgi:hypothetical protein
MNFTFCGPIAKNEHPQTMPIFCQSVSLIVPRVPVGEGQGQQEAKDALEWLSA